MSKSPLQLLLPLLLGAAALGSAPAARAQTSRIGIIVDKPPFDTCMEGNPTHLLLSPGRGRRVESTRLVGANRTTIRQLRELSGSNRTARCVGDFVGGIRPGCEVLKVERINLMRDNAPRRRDARRAGAEKGGTLQ